MDVLGGDNSEQIGKKEGGTYSHRFRVRMHLQMVLDHNLGLGKLILSERGIEEKRNRPWPLINDLPIAIAFPGPHLQAMVPPSTRSA